MIVPDLACPVLAILPCLFVPSVSPSMIITDRRLTFIGFNNVFFGIIYLVYICLDIITDFFVA
jgi:hypothetical protein